MCNAGRGCQDTGMGHGYHMSHVHATWLQGLPSSEYSVSKAWRDAMVVLCKPNVLMHVGVRLQVPACHASQCILACEMLSF